jgi:hypothetical protein
MKLIYSLSKSKKIIEFSYIFITGNKMHQHQIFKNISLGLIQDKCVEIPIVQYDMIHAELKKLSLPAWSDLQQEIPARFLSLIHILVIR